MKAPEDLQCRVVVIGDSSVGKTSLLNRIVENTFNPSELSTVGANYQLVTRTINDKKMEIQVWDTAGQEKFRSLSPIYFRNSIGAIAVYDQTNKNSFANLEMWIKMFTDIAGANTVISVAANKADLVEHAEVPFNEAKAWCDNNGFTLVQTSASSGIGVSELFEGMIPKLANLIAEKKQGTDYAKIQKKESGCSC